MTITERVLDRITKSEYITLTQIRRVGSKNPTSLINRLRNQGYKIITENTRLKNNHVHTVYKYGKAK